MKSIKKILVGVAYIGTLAFAPLAFSVAAHAQPAPTLQCDTRDEEQSTIECDLGINKAVSINDGAFVDANTADSAASAVVGDKVTWKITVTNNSAPGLIPFGTIAVTDILPGGVTFVSYTASAGTYDTTSNQWQFTLDGSTSYPVTLTIVTNATSTGLAKNTASFNTYTRTQCEVECTFEYGDFNPENNSDDAFANISGQPVVLAASTTLTNTGSGTTESLIAGGLIAATVLVTFLGRKQRVYKINR